MQTFARWTDLDPEAPGNQYAYFRMHWIAPKPLFRGSTSPAGDRLLVELQKNKVGPYWKITLKIYDPYRDPETFAWEDIYVDPTKPFDTRMLSDVHVPCKDFRYVRITS